MTTPARGPGEARSGLPLGAGSGSDRSGSDGSGSDGSGSDGSGSDGSGDGAGGAAGAGAVVERAAALVELRRYGQAVTVLSGLLGQDPANAVAWLLLAEAHYCLDQQTAALDAVTECLRRDPVNPQAWRIRSWILRSLDRHDQALHASAEAVRLDPDDWRSHYGHAVSLNCAGLGARAYTAAVHAATLAPQEAEAHHLVARIAVSVFGQAAWATAERATTTALTLDPRHTGVHLTRGGLHLHRDGTAGIPAWADTVARALAAEPNAGLAHAALGVLAGAVVSAVLRLAVATLVLAVPLRYTLDAALPLAVAWRVQGAAAIVGAGAWTALIAWMRRRLPPSLRGPVRKRLTRTALFPRTAATAILLVLSVVVLLAPATAVGSFGQPARPGPRLTPSGWPGQATTDPIIPHVYQPTP